MAIRTVCASRPSTLDTRCWLHLRGLNAPMTRLSMIAALSYKLSNCSRLISCWVTVHVEEVTQASGNHCQRIRMFRPAGRLANVTFSSGLFITLITTSCFCTDNNVVFLDLSEGARQQLESLRADTRHRAAVSIQSTWRGWHLRRRWPTVKRQLELHSRRANAASAVSSGSAGSIPSGQQQQTQQQHAIQQLHHHSQQHPAASSTLNRHLAQQQQSQPTVHQPQSGPVQQQSFGRPRPQPIACTPPPEGLLGSSSGNTTGMTQSITAGQQHQQHQEKCDAKTIQHTCSLFGLDLVSHYSFTLAPDGINVNPIHWEKKMTGW